jgi:hypothetical protein
MYEFYGTFDHERLQTTTTFSTIQFFAELDETLAMFTRRFWRELSYGSFTWGVLPFVSELKALLESIKRASTRQSTYREMRRRDKLTTASFSIYPISVNFDLNWRVTAAKTGAIDTSMADEASKLLDRLGIYADLNTAWDLIPLSFVVDWILPVGKLLSAISPSGNIRSVGFLGYNSLKLEISGRVTGGSMDRGSDSRYNTGMSFQGKYYRRYLSNELLTIGSKPVDFEFPSILELFNMLYIFVLSKRR